MAKKKKKKKEKDKDKEDEKFEIGFDLNNLLKVLSFVTNKKKANMEIDIDSLDDYFDVKLEDEDIDEMIFRVPLIEEDKYDVNIPKDLKYEYRLKMESKKWFDLIKNMKKVNNGSAIMKINKEELSLALDEEDGCKIKNLKCSFVKVKKSKSKEDKKEETKKIDKEEDESDNDKEGDKDDKYKIKKDKKVDDYKNSYNLDYLEKISSCKDLSKEIKGYIVKTIGMLKMSADLLDDTSYVRYYLPSDM